MAVRRPASPASSPRPGPRSLSTRSSRTSHSATSTTARRSRSSRTQLPNDAPDFHATTGAGLSGFNLDDDAGAVGENATLSNTKVFENVNPGDYTVTEGAVGGWDLTGLVCDDGSPVDLGTRTASIHVDAHESVTCTYTNTKRGKIIIEKQTNPDGAFGLVRLHG